MKEIYDRILGSLYTAAMGDALGAPTETMSAAEIPQYYGGRVTFFVDGAVNPAFHNAGIGEISDDTSQLYEMARAVIASGGNLTAEGAALSVLVSLQLMRNAGLVVGTAVSGAAGSITGVLVAVAKEGLPKVPYAAAALAVCTGVTVLAGVLCSCASAANAKGEAKGKRKTGMQNILLLAAFVVLSNGYIYGTSTGNKAHMNPVAICLFLCFGAFFLMLTAGAVTATVRRQWKEILCIGRSKNPLVFSAVSAVCHYGGNLLSILCMPVLSATLSFLIGRSANIWTFFFGIYLGEFRESGKKVRLLLTAGIALYVLGILLIALFFY